MSDIANALMSALGLGKKPAPMAAPPNTSAAPWDDPSLRAPAIKPNPMSIEGGGGPGLEGGSGSTDRDQLDQLMMEIMKQKQMAAAAGGQRPPQ